MTEESLPAVPETLEESHIKLMLGAIESVDDIHYYHAAEAWVRELRKRVKAATQLARAWGRAWDKAKAEFEPSLIAMLEAEGDVTDGGNFRGESALGSTWIEAKATDLGYEVEDEQRALALLMEHIDLNELVVGECVKLKLTAVGKKLAVQLLTDGTAEVVEVGTFRVTKPGIAKRTKTRLSNPEKRIRDLRIRAERVLPPLHADDLLSDWEGGDDEDE